MQEVEVPPRDTFAHYVYVERPQRNLLWWFNTKRHNIAFGLYYLPGQVEGAQVKAELKDDPTSSINHANTSNNAGNLTQNGLAVSGGHQDPASLTTSTVDANRTLMPIASRMGRSTSMSIPSNTSNDELMASGHKHARNHRSGSSVSSMASTITQGQYRSSSPTNLSIDQGNATITAAGLARTPTAADSVASTLHTPLGATNDTTATMANTSQMGQAPITISRTASPAASIVSASGVVAPLNGSNSPNLPPPPPTPTMRSRQRTNFRPKDPRMVELMPVEVCESSRRTIRGQYEVKEAGTYVFIFDNSFSWNTTKRLTFFVAAKDGSSEPTATLDYAGWVLKKKRKMMQGWAKRWVQIEDGVLSYAKYPHSASRGTVRIALSTISVVPQHRTIHIDSGTSTYHMKAINDEDFKQCVGALRRYKALSNYVSVDDNEDNGSMDGSIHRHHNKSSVSSNDLRVATLRSQQTGLLAGIAPNETGASTSSIELELENIAVILSATARASLDDSSLALNASGNNTSSQHHRASASISSTSSQKANSSNKTGGKLRFSFTPNKEKRDSTTPNDPATTPTSSSSSSDTEGTLVLSTSVLSKLKLSLDLIRRENKQQCELLQQATQWRLLAQSEMEKYRAEINELRGQLGLESLPPCSADESTATLFDPESTWNTSIHSSIGPGGNDSPSSFTSSTLSRRVGAGSNNSPGSFASSTMSRRISVMSTASKASDIFFDAEEDIILADDSDSESGEEVSRDENGQEQMSNATFQLSDIDNDDDDDDDEGMIERVEEAIVGVVTTTGGSIVGRRSSVAPSQSSRATGKRQYQRASRIFSDANQSVLSSDSVNEADDTVDANAEVAADATTSETIGQDAIVNFERRVQLPAPTCETEISFLSLLRKNIGKDLSTVAMPVALNEPINLLQKLCEELEYSELLDKASEQADSLERLLFISAFVVSGYASTQYRSTRKPFNPLHGETYECVREDKGFKFISEKVSHNPPIMACHAESENFIFHQDSKLKSKFWGKSMELSPSGTVHITLPKWNEQYTYCKPATWMRNMLAGNRYLEHSGEVRVQNHTTGEYCLLNFKEGGMFSASTNEVIGTAYNAKGKKVHTINGRWTEIMYHEREKNQLNVLWRAEPPPANHEAQYGFTTFTVQLNELTPDLQVPGVLPITDTRLRPDQRAYEEGRVDEADALKAELEDAQRQRRRQMEASGASWQTQWFELKKHPNCKEPCWQYTGGYWETREKRQFNAIHQLW